MSLRERTSSIRSSEKYGVEMFERLDAEFAMVIYDAKKDDLIAARDPIGIRPLFYAYDSEGSIMFASEAKNLIGLSDKVMPFPPGHYYEDGKFICYKDLSKRQTYSSDDLETACKKIKELLVKGVEKRLDADAPVGFLLSGGLDSSLVCAISQKILGKPIKTFAIGMNEDAIDLKYAKEAADFIGSDHTEFYMTPDEVISTLDELIRLLGEKGIEFDEAVEIVTKTCAYTNHTILAEALEKWPRAYLDAVVPQLMPIIEKLDALARTRTKDESLAIIDKDDRVHMAHMDIHFTHSTNGVAALHTEILKNSELHGFYELYPEKFNNKTNGITFRRWLLECDPALTAELEQHIGSGFRKDAAELEKLLAFADDETVLGELTAVKKANKEALADWLLRTQKVQVNPSALFDIQSKRLHEYKRQQLNLLYLIHQYYEIKAGHLPAVPLVSIFGAKAAPAYTIAKDIIHALLTLSKVIAADPEVSKWLQVVFVENYNVTAAEKLIPACDLSEQISLASKEASGTGNMKFMLNGALTLGTMDGANVEISQQVGDENIYIFGQTSDQVIHRYAVGDYDPAQWVEGDANIRRAISFLTGPEMLAAGHAENLTRLHNELIRKDWFQTLPDFNAYVVRKGQALSDYACDPMGWRRKCLVNIAKAGMFSSDRTIAEYDRDIWHLGK